MEIGIIGLPESGKTTVFNALTHGKADVGTFAASGPNVGVAKVPDPRLDALDGIFHPRRRVPAEVKYIDVAVPTRQELSGQFLAHLSQSDGLLHVVRAFESEKVPHIEGSVDAERDIRLVDMELAFSDMSIIERRLQKIEGQLKAAKPQEREAFSHEQALLARLKAGLETEVPIRQQELSDDDRRAIAGYQFLSAKPLLIVLNIGESQLPQASDIEQEWRTRFRRPHVDVAALCAELEMELAQLEDTDAVEFRQSMGISEAALERILRLSYQLLGLISFFTYVSEEVRAWTIKSGTDAVHAAGKIHTDMERGFIRAEVIGYDDLVQCGSIAEGKKHGLLHTEGKGYTVSDGDVITFLFNV